jgi:branched-chain amino acid transport system permease protein
MHEFVAFTIIGIVSGATYAVAASGLVVTYSTSGIFNIAHGAIGMFMAFVFWQLSVPWHLPSGLAFVITVFVLAPLAGALIERILIRRVAGASVTVTLVVTVGLTLLLIGLAERIWNGQSPVVAQFFGHDGFTLFGVYVVYEDVITIGIAIAIAIGLRLFLYRSRVGIAMRGVVDNRDLVGLFGGRPTRLSTFSWSIGASLASVAGILAAPILQLNPLILTLLVIDAYAAAMLGRLRNLPMTFVGALGIGLAASFATGYFPRSGIWDSTPVQGLELSVPSVLLFVVLLVLPMSRIRSGTVRRQTSLGPAGLGRSIQGGVALVVAVAVAVAFLDPGNVVTLGIGLAFGLICLSLVPLTGWGGQVSICQMTFAGLGAYAMFKFGSGGSLLGLLAAAGLAGAVGALIALPALRLRGLYLALATMAFATLMDNSFFPWSAAFGFDGSLHIVHPSLFGLHITTGKSFDIFLAVVFALLSIALLALRRGPFGRVLMAMKDSEAACATLGLSLTTTKLIVFALSAALAGLAGALFGAASSVADATDFQMFFSLLVLAAVAVGGAATCSGALAGGLVLGFLPQSVEYIAIGLAGVTLGANPDGLLPLGALWARRRWSGAMLGIGGRGAGPLARPRRSRLVPGATAMVE